MTDDPDTSRARARLRPWTALALPALAWFGFEIGLAGALRLSCTAVGAGLGVGWGAASLAVCALAAWLAWPQSEAVDDKSPSPPWLARVALVVAGLFAIAIAYQTVASLIIPPCAR